LIHRLRILPRWIIILIDISILAISTFSGFLLRFNFHWEEISQFLPFTAIGTNVLCGLVALMITKSYAGIVRYTGIQDGIRIFYTSALNLVLAVMVNLLYYYNYAKNLIPFSVLLISFLASFLFLFYYRLIVKSIFSFYSSSNFKKDNVLIYGAGQSGMMVKQMIDNDSSAKLNVVAFIEDDAHKLGKEINGTGIHSFSEFSELVEAFEIKELIVSFQRLSFEKKNEVVDLCLRNNVKVRSVPPVEKWVKGELSLRQIKEIKIEDLLGRESIKLEDDALLSELSGRRIIITGAAGSIGSELARQLLLYNPSVLILVDQAESPLYEIERELFQIKTQTRIEIFVGDIRNVQRIRHIFRETDPEILFHAAAYKHVPLMESNPYEAVTCNIFGTRNLADLAVEFHLKKFVMVSTDKAVNPTSVMGCSKRIAEIYVQSLNHHLEINANGVHTAFVTTRFGNVLGSNGSVIPLFKKQILQGGPVTVTHPEITRYFMTIPEACRLVLEAGTMGKGGEVFIFDMGKPIKILDLAKKMVFLSGLDFTKDIEIVFTGLREGEKLYEELLNDKENTIPTHHEKILKARTTIYNYESIAGMIDLFQELIDDRNELKMVALMKELVPEYKSNYSRYEVLDAK
jgi:FlaA1/EpsC-like NDP-sugar epimerase